MANEHIFKSNVIVTGSIETSTGFVGDGSGLTGITSTTAWDGNLNGDAAITGSLVVSSSTAIVDFQDTTGVSGSFSGSYEGNGSNLTNLSIDNVTATGVNLAGTFTGNGSALTGLEPFPYYGDAKITGSLIVSSSVVDLTDSIAISGSIFSGSFVGDGTGLSGLTASPAGSDHEVQFNDNGTTGASSNLSFSNGELFVSESIQVSKSGRGLLKLSQEAVLKSNGSAVSTLEAKGATSNSYGTFSFIGSTAGGTITEYLTLSGTVTDAGSSLIKGGKLSVGNSPVDPTSTQGNLYVKRTMSTNLADSDTVATFENSNSSAFGGGGFIDIVGNSNDSAIGGIRIKNGSTTDGEIMYSGVNRTMTFHTNKRTGTATGGFKFKHGASVKMHISASGDVGIGTETPQAALDVSSTTDGFLPPRLSSAQMYSISSPPAGLMIWNTVVDKLCVYNGSNWQSLDATTLPTLQDPI